MTQIANARFFDGVDDVINFTVGGLSGAWGAMSIGVIIKPTTPITANGVAIELSPSITLPLEDATKLLYAYDEDTVNSLGNEPYNNDEWNLFVVTKPTGTATARLHKYRYSTTTWTHSAGEGGNQPALPSVTGARVGLDAFSNIYKGLIACAGVWKSTELSDANVETLEDDIANWTTLSPTSLWLFNQTDVATDVLDLVGNSHESSITGTTATAVADLAFDVGGVEGASVYWVGA
jgi:hypothetical protein